MNHYYTNSPKLKNKSIIIDYTYKGYHLSLFSDLGVFSKNRVDFGTHLLLQSFNSNSQKELSILDLGCGYGIIGLALAMANPKYDIELIDINKRAVELVKKNIKKLKITNAKTYESNLYENVKKRFDVIITNPPIRAGKEVVYAIFKEGLNYLSNEGVIWSVIRKAQGAELLLKYLEVDYNVDIELKSKGYIVFSIKKKRK